MIMSQTATGNKYNKLIISLVRYKIGVYNSTIFAIRTFCYISVSYCPVSHPYAFFKGKYCCEGDRGCDGAYIDYSNNCCKKGNYLNCPSSASCHSTGWCWFTVLIVHICYCKMPTICLITLFWIYINRYLLWCLTCSIRWPIRRLLRDIQQYDGARCCSTIALWILP